MHVSNSVRIAEQIWREQYKTFVENSLHSASASVHDNTKKKKLLLFIQKNSLVSSKSNSNQLALSQTGKNMEAYILFLNLKKLFSISADFLLTKTICIRSPFLKMDNQSNIKRRWICQLACTRQLNPHSNQLEPTPHSNQCSRQTS